MYGPDSRAGDGIPVAATEGQHFSRGRTAFLSQNPPQIVQNEFNTKGYLRAHGSQAESVFATAHAAAF